ncbi:MAG: AI-2E family transporter, partial [Flammeovirgaceae bacterium]|nr:AI-2E family transporter [Flammeovirgaceae bacterium]
VQLIALAVLFFWCFQILKPFLSPLIGGSILAVTLYPLHVRLTSWLKGKKNWSAVMITLLLLSILIVPAITLLISTASEFKHIAIAYREGDIFIPPPAEAVKAWPLIGEQAYGYWSEAANDLGEMISRHKEEVKSIAVIALDLLASTGNGLVVFTLSIIVGGFFLAFSSTAGAFARSVFINLAGSQGESMLEISRTTVQNVAKGILGVALIQAMLAGLGMGLAGIPLTGLWVLICMILAVVQIGILPVSIGVIIYIWNTAEPLTAGLLTGWMILIGLVDNVLKPYLMGKGSSVPMLVVFLGSLGGFIVDGFMGLFLGAIFLSLGYILMMDWLNKKDPTGSPQA